MSSFRLESPRPRSALPPIRIRSPGHTPSSLTSPTTLLYDLPQASSRSPPPQTTESLLYSPPPPNSPPLSPTTPRRARQTPPPRPRNSTPLQSQKQELDQFAGLCRAFYFEQNERAGQLMTQTLEAVDASQRAAFSRLQATIRSAYHTAMAKRRLTEFRAHLSSTHPGGSLSPSSRAHPGSQAAQKERYDRFSVFLRTWCTMGMPGPRPFFQALWAVMRLQVLPTDLGGAGPRRIEWEFDDAVFQESAGKEFMMEAVDVLKGVLGFEEYLPPCSPRSSFHAEESNTPSSEPHPTSIRPRSPSDPFLDTPTLSRSVATSSSRSPKSLLHSTPEEQHTFGDPIPTCTSNKDTFDNVGDQPQIRIWVAADLCNPELQSLLALFPDFITRQNLPRFPGIQTRTRQREHDLEEGLDITAGDRKSVSCGTGRMWIGEKLRRSGWRGNLWQRFVGWWKRLFC